MWIMISGPYRSGAKSEAEAAANLTRMNEVAYHLFAAGHVPVIGVNLAKPVIDAVGSEHYDEIMMPLSLALVERCDAVLRVGGPSKGADREVAMFVRRGLPVFTDPSEIPAAGAA